MSRRATAAVAGFVLCCCAGGPPAVVEGPSPVSLRCEYVERPLGVDVAVPRFSWIVGDPARGAVQSAFQILVASRPELLTPDKADCWNSGFVAGDRTVHVEWGGPKLRSATRYHWTVRCLDGAGRASRFAAPTWFETGLLDESDWGASWIGDGRAAPANDESFYGDLPAPRFRKAFALAAAPVRARLVVAGLGYHVASLNGRRVGDHRLDPAWTRFDRLVPYAVHDVTGLLQTGNNVIGVELGNGWYAPLPLRMWGKLNLRDHLAVGMPKLRCRLTVLLADGSTQVITSDTTWRTAPGPVIRNNIYLGERHDARRDQPGWDRAGFDDSAWTAVAPASPPGGQLRWLPVPPIRETHVLRPGSIREVAPGVHVVDFGQNFAGVVRLRVRASAGTEVRLRFAEERHADGTIDVDSTVAAQIKRKGLGGPGAPDVAWQEDRFVCRGGGDEVFEPRFTWHGFRYVEITGLPTPPEPDDVAGVRWNTDLADVSSFECSNPLLNRIQQVVEWTLLSNAYGILSDCPARERFGYGGDMVASADAYLANFDMAALHTKAVEDFAREARPDGGLPECAPDIGVNEKGLTSDSGPLGWSFAHPFLLHRAWKWYGNRRLVEQQYETLARFVQFCRERIPDGVTIACLGDHGCVGLNPPGVHATATWHRITCIAAELATELGRDAEAREHEALADSIRAAFAKWVVPETGVVLVPTQTSQATALANGIVPEALREKAFAVLLSQIAADGDRLTTGMFGTGFLLQCLGDAGRGDLAWQLISTREYPGYGFMIDQGATTLWEHWSRAPHWSRNHPMYSVVSAWFQDTLLGIRQAEGSVGWQHAVVAPSPLGDLAWARGHLDTVRGRIRSEWRRDAGTFVLDVTIPANVRATIFVPLRDGAREVHEGGAVVMRDGAATGAVAGVDVRVTTATACEVHVGGGTYRFEVR